MIYILNCLSGSELLSPNKCPITFIGKYSVLILIGAPQGVSNTALSRE